MRRDYFTLDIREEDPPDEGRSPKPTARIDFEGPVDELTERLRTDDGTLDAEDIDIGYRLLTSMDDEDASGVLSVTIRLTGEFVLELNAEADTVLDLVRAARRHGTDTDDDDSYRLRIVVDGETTVDYEKSTFLVYDADGDLLRQHSLIPSGVEL
jgi:hypothetical protein